MDPECPGWREQLAGTAGLGARFGEPPLGITRCDHRRRQVANQQQSKRKRQTVAKRLAHVYSEAH
jgi:hypothetical protein